jgi:hypothetical protein
MDRLGVRVVLGEKRLVLLVVSGEGILVKGQRIRLVVLLRGQE